VWQLAYSPASVVGSIEASSLADAIDMARAMWGSFAVVKWPDATVSERERAAAADLEADRAAFTALTL
jgi:hypothetical protein